MRKPMPSADRPRPNARELADLSALADGTLDPVRRDAVTEHIAASPELRALYDREQRVVLSLQAAGRRDRAPAELRARIGAARPGPRARARARRRAGYGSALAGALAVIVLAVVLVLPAGTPGAPSFGEAAALGALAPSSPAPAPDPGAPTVQLGRNVGDVYFPNWGTRLHWRATGERDDRLHGRLAVTVFYAWRGARIAYTIVAAPALKVPAGSWTRLRGAEYRTLRRDGRTLVTWRRDRHTCVLSSTRVPASTMLSLAASEA